MRRRTIRGMAAVLLMVLGACGAGSSAGAAPEGYVIVFDAAEKKFEGAIPSKFAAGRMVKVKIKNPNSFSEKYRITLRQIDFHTAALPDVLKPYLNRVTPVESTGGFRGQSELAIAKIALPDDLKPLVKKLLDAARELDEVINADPPVLADPEIDNRIARTIMSGTTNREIRAFAAVNVAEYFDRVELARCELDKDPKLKGLYAKIEFTQWVPDRTNALFNVLNPERSGMLGQCSQPTKNPMPLGPRAIPEVKEDYDKETELPRLEQLRNLMLEPRDQALRLLNQRISPVAKALRELDTEIDKLRVGTGITMEQQTALDALRTLANNATARGTGRRRVIRYLSQGAERAQLLFAHIIDPDQVRGTPEEIIVQDVAAKDKMSIEISVESIPFERQVRVFVPLRAEDEAGTPPAGGSPAAGTPVGSAAPAAGMPSTPEPAPDPNTASVVKFTRSVPIYGRWVLDFGGGLVATTLRQPNFHTRTVNGKAIVREGPGDTISLGAGVFAQYYKTTKGIAFGPAFGVMAQDPIRYLAGFGFTVGNSTRLSIIVGAAFGKVNRLNGNEVGQELNGSLGVVSVMRSGGFISAVYSIKF